jgi:hypothetical protein
VPQCLERPDGRPTTHPIHHHSPTGNGQYLGQGCPGRRQGGARAAQGRQAGDPLRPV